MKVAVVQMDIKIQNKAYNRGRILDRLEAAAKEGANLVVFPECALTGYCFDSPEDALPVAEPVPGAGAERIAEAAKDLDCYAVVGMLERVGREVYNAAVVIGPEGVLGSYHKAHMPFLGIDRYNAYGEEAFPVFETRYGKVGVNICFDLNFPESARTAKLRGARLLVVPTNWPAGTNTYKHVVNARGHENHMFVAVANRVGTERGCEFCGHSKIVDLRGETVAEADGTKETILYGEFDIAEADQNHIATKPGEWELDRIADRRPELYTALTEPLPKNLKTPREKAGVRVKDKVKV